MASKDFAKRTSDKLLDFIPEHALTQNFKRLAKHTSSPVNYRKSLLLICKIFIFSFPIQELREAFEKESKETGKERLLLSIAMPAGQDYIDNGFDIPKIAK